MRHGHADGDAPEALPQRERDEDEQHDMGDAQHEVDEPGDRGIGLLPAQRRHRAHDQRDDGRHARGQKTHQHAGGQPRQRAQQHVAPHPVGAERMGEAGSEVLHREVGCRSRIRDDEPRDHHSRQRRQSTQKRRQRQPPIPHPSRARSMQKADSQVKQVSTRSSAMSSPLAHAGIHHAVQRAGYQVAGEHEGGGE